MVQGREVRKYGRNLIKVYPMDPKGIRQSIQGCYWDSSHQIITPTWTGMDHMVVERSEIYKNHPLPEYLISILMNPEDITLIAPNKGDITEVLQKPW